MPATVHSIARRRVRVGFTLVEIVVVLVMLAVMAAVAYPKLDFQKYRVDAAVQGLRTVLMQAQRTALTRQYDVIITVDTAHNTLRWYEDANDDGIIQSSEHERAYPLNDGVKFAIPPVGIDSVVHASVVGSLLGTLNGLPSITFHRDGAASTDLELYISGPGNPTITYRAIRLTQGTGRTDMYRYNSQAGIWQVGGLN